MELYKTEKKWMSKNNGGNKTVMKMGKELVGGLPEISTNSTEIQFSHSYFHLYFIIWNGLWNNHLNMTMNAS